VSALPPAIEAKIEAARRRLNCAVAVLDCLTFAADHDAEADFADAARAARELVERSIAALDSVELERVDK
jgi:hypothetical protein